MNREDIIKKLVHNLIKFLEPLIEENDMGLFEEWRDWSLNDATKLREWIRSNLSPHRDNMGIVSTIVLASTKSAIKESDLNKFERFMYALIDCSA